MQKKKHKMKINGKISLSFIILLILEIALGNLGQFLVLLLCVTLHELGHIFIARLFGLHIDLIVFTALGEKCVIKDMLKLSCSKQVLIYIAGPLINLFLWAVGIYFNLHNLAEVNMYLFIFNLLPLYPLDGGKIFQAVLGETVGVLKSNKIVTNLSKFGSTLMITIGFLDLFFQGKLCLLVMGLYLKVRNADEFMFLTVEFYKIFFYGDKDAKRTKIIKAKEDASIEKIMQKIPKGKSVIIETSLRNIKEKDFKNHIHNFGIVGNLRDIK